MRRLSRKVKKVKLDIKKSKFFTNNITFLLISYFTIAILFQNCSEHQQMAKGIEGKYYQQNAGQPLAKMIKEVK